MSYTGEFNELAAAFDKIWNRRTLVAWPNVAFNPPTPASEWCRFTILDGAASRMSIGNPGLNRAVYPGRVVLQVFAPRNRGEVVARKYADEAAGIFRTLRISNYRFDLPYVEPVNTSTVDTYYQVNVNCPFQRDVYHG